MAKHSDRQKKNWLREALSRLSLALVARALWTVISEHLHQP
jgi:hypothetical protein